MHLTPTEFDLLATLARKPKTVFKREKLLEEVWDWPDASGTRTVDSHVKALRHKLLTALRRFQWQIRLHSSLDLSTSSLDENHIFPARIMLAVPCEQFRKRTAAKFLEFLRQLTSQNCPPIP